MHKLLQLSVRRMIQVTVFIFLVQGHAYADHSQQPNDAKTQAAITSAELVLDEFMRAFNATDVSAWVAIPACSGCQWGGGGCSR